VDVRSGQVNSAELEKPQRRSTKKARKVRAFNGREMTTYQFRAPHCRPTRGSLRRGHDNTWSVVGGWFANNNAEASQGWKDDPIPLRHDRVLADKYLSSVDHLDVETLNVHHHERKKRLTAFVKAGKYAFTEREARARGSGRAGLPLNTPDNLAYGRESQVYDSVLDGHVHPALQPEGVLDNEWCDGIARDGRGVAGGYAANQHPDIETTTISWQTQMAANKKEQERKNKLVTRGRAWVDMQEPPEDIKQELADQMFMKLPSFMSVQPRPRNDLMSGELNTPAFTCSGIVLPALRTRPAKRASADIGNHRPQRPKRLANACESCRRHGE
jgi:hypothetical protein